MINKKNIGILAFCVICALSFSSFAIFQTTAQNPNMDNLLGSWDAEVTVEAQGATFPALITFGAGGIVIADEPPQPGETSGHGNWVSTSDNQVAYTFVSLYSGEGGIYNGRLKVVGTLQFDAGTVSWQGPFKIDVFDANDQVVFSDKGTVDMTLIALESME